MGLVSQIAKPVGWALLLAALPAIAQAQYDMGRGGWFCFSTKDVDRIHKVVTDVVTKLFSAAFKK